MEVVLLVIEALGTFAKVLEEKLKIIGIKTRINELQKIVGSLVGTMPQE